VNAARKAGFWEYRSRTASLANRKRIKRDRYRTEAAMIDFKQCGLAVTLSVAMLAPKFAQAQQPGGLSVAANETTTLPWLAPVGHRQPRAADIPASPRNAIDPEDASVDRLIRGVCRGC
jgi:hypothetical protein